jgi:N utilization substance protein A
MQSNSFSLHHVIEQVSRERGIDPQVLVEATEQAILTAAKRSFGMNRELEAKFNKETGSVDLFQYMTVVEEVDNPDQQISMQDAKKFGLDADIGEELGFQIFYLQDDAEKARQQDKEFGELLHLQQHRQGFGRIAAQTAKQVILQRVRDAERERVFNEYKDRRGELIAGVVRRFERGSNIIVDLDQGRTEAVLPSKEQTPRENYRPGDRIVAFVKDIDREARGPQIILSRSDVGLLVKLFEMEVPEIYEGIVRIVAASREPGSRSKIAVTSRDTDVDPVGACVGMKGSRVQAVVQELRGEKIDIVPWDRDPARFVCNAIAPAEVVRVVIDEGAHTMELVVPDAKLSLAIGKRGQNVRLASQLTHWKLDIISETRFKQIEEESLSSLLRIDGVDEGVAKTLYKSGFRSLDEIMEASDQELTAITGVGDASAAAQLRERASVAIEVLRKERLQAALAGETQLTERDRMLLIPGLGERGVESLERAGYRSLEEARREQDLDRFALRTGLGATKAKAIQEAIRSFLTELWPQIRTAQQARALAESDAAAEHVPPSAPASQEPSTL